MSHLIINFIRMTNFSQAYEACRRSQSCCVRRSAGIDVHRALRGFVPYLSNIHICNRNMCSACLHYLVHALEISISLLFMQIYNINNLETYFLENVFCRSEDRSGGDSCIEVIVVEKRRIRERGIDLRLSMISA